MGIQTPSILEGYRQAIGPRSTHSRVFELVGHDARFYDHGKAFKENCYKYTVTLPGRRSIRFSVHVLEATGVHDWGDIVIKKLKESMEADDQFIWNYASFQGAGYY